MKKALVLGLVLGLVLASISWGKGTFCSKATLEQWQKTAFVGALLYCCRSDSGITDNRVAQAAGLIITTIEYVATATDEDKQVLSEENKDTFFWEVYQQLHCFIREEKARGNIIVPVSPPTVPLSDDSRG